MIDIAMQVLGWTVYAACFVGGIGFILCVVADDSMGAGIVCGAIFVPLWIMLGLWIYDENYTDHPTFTLRTDQWECQAWAVSQETYYIQMGKIMVPQTQEVKTCTQYNMKG